MKLFFIAWLGLLAPASALFGQEAGLVQSMQRGQEIYSDFCVTCHMESGEGVPNVFPPLAASDYLLENRAAAIRAVKYGQSGEITVNGVTYNNMMMELGLTDEEVADVMNYVLHSWGNNGGAAVTALEVEAIEPE